jgi:hypothetical protein
VVIRQVSVAAGLMVACCTTALIGQGGAIRREAPTQPERQIERSSVNFSTPWRPTATRVVGTVIDIGMTPVGHVKVQLRNLDTGTVEQVTESNTEGEYAFEVDDPATYVVEMVMIDGYVIALSNAGSVANFETLNTVVQLPGRWDTALQNITYRQAPVQFLGLSAATSMTAATITLAVDTNIPPANAGVPVSPVTP